MTIGIQMENYSLQLPNHWRNVENSGMNGFQKSKHKQAADFSAVTFSMTSLSTGRKSNKKPLYIQLSFIFDQLETEIVSSLIFR